MSYSHTKKPLLQEWAPNPAEAEADHRRAKAEGESAQTQIAQDWADSRGITHAGMTRAERTAACMAFCKRINGAEKVPSRQWAKDILDNVAHGEIVASRSVELAKAALKVEEEKVAA